MAVQELSNILKSTDLRYTLTAGGGSYWVHGGVLDIEYPLTTLETILVFNWKKNFGFQSTRWAFYKCIPRAQIIVAQTMFKEL